MSLSHTALGALRRTELFGTFEPAQLQHLGFEERSIAKGAALVKQGEQADSLFVVLDGRLEAVLDGAQQVALERLEPGSVVGEIALMVGGRRSATVRALEDARVLVLTKERFERTYIENAQLAESFTRVLHERMRRIRIARYLQEVLGPLDAAQLNQVEQQAQWRHLDSGEVLFRQGDAPDGAFIVAAGRLRVAVEENGSSTVIDEVGPGMWMGEMALLTGKPRSATVYAVRDTELLWLSQAAFDSLIVKSPRALLQTSRQLVDRLQRQMTSQRRPRAQLRAIAVVPVSDGADVRPFVAQVVKALSAYGPTMHLDSQRVDEALGKRGISDVEPSDPAQLRLSPWLIEQESAHRFVVLEGDPKLPRWSERAVRHADHVLLVGDGVSSPELGELELKLKAMFSTPHSPKRSLVLLQPDRRHLPGAAAWLSRRNVDGHFQVRRGNDADVGRMVRIVTGKAICLVFGGGGSRGYAHIGVVRAFEELGIPIDAVGGSSIGAVIGAACALGLSAKEMIDLAPQLAQFLDPTLPVVSLTSGIKAVEVLNSVVGELHIEDLVGQFFCMSTNLSRGGEVVHRTGPVVLAVRASGAVPGIMPPVAYKGDLLVDGGLSNNVPVDTMASLFEGAIVAIDVIPELDLKSGGALPPALSGWKVAWSWLSPFTRRIDMPNIVSILMRTATTAGLGLRKGMWALKQNGLVLKPPLDRWNMLDFKEAEPIAEQGYRYALPKVRAWWEQHRDELMGDARA
jgi:predicted acylesterase/phospholipase RssA/CRP-like cAMP-binding protein